VSRRVSYDVDVATHDRPAPGEAPAGVTVDGPFEVEPADLAEPLAAAVLAPRWLLQVSGDRDAARRAGRALAEAHRGAAYDRQEDAVFFPRGRAKRVAAGKAEKTSIVCLRWTGGDPGALLDVLRRHAPEGLPRRYGDVEPPQHEDLAGFAAFAREHDTLWYASRPFFGGSADPAGSVGIEVDRRVIKADERWREAIVGLFAAGAAAMGATTGEAYAERGWEVSRTNRLWISARYVGREHRGPAWLEWDGRQLVRHGRLPRTRYPLLSRSRSAVKPG
jgi:hypothetical protein